MATETLRIRKADSIFDEIEKMRDQIMQRAHDIFLRNGGAWGEDANNWLAAEQELVWKPAIELHEKDNEFFLEIAASGVDPKDLEIEVTPEDLLVKGRVLHEHKEDKGTIHTCEFASGSLFRSIHFPKKIDPEKVKAEFRNGMVHLRAPVAAEQRGRRVSIEAA